MVKIWKKGRIYRLKTECDQRCKISTFFALFFLFLLLLSRFISTEENPRTVQREVDQLEFLLDKQANSDYLKGWYQSPFPFATHLTNQPYVTTNSLSFFDELNASSLSSLTIH